MRSRDSRDQLSRFGNLGRLGRAVKVSGCWEGRRVREQERIPVRAANSATGWREGAG